MSDEQQPMDPETVSTEATPVEREAASIDPRDPDAAEEISELVEEAPPLPPHG